MQIFGKFSEALISIFSTASTTSSHSWLRTI